MPKQETKRNENSIYQCRHCLPECQPKSSFSNKHDLQPTPNQRKVKRVNNQKGNEREPRKDTPTALTIAGHGSSNMRAATISTAPEKYCSTEVTSLSCTGTPLTSQSIDVIIEKWKSHKLLVFLFFSIFICLHCAYNTSPHLSAIRRYICANSGCSGTCRPSTRLGRLYLRWYIQELLDAIGRNIFKVKGFSVASDKGDNRRCHSHGRPFGDVVKGTTTDHPPHQLLTAHRALAEQYGC